MYKQLVTLANGQRLLISTNPNIYLYNGEPPTQLVFLGNEADPDDWKEITQEEYESILVQQEKQDAE